ncbi:hypothetical protein N1F78_10715 [Seonamhaeicola sp. MEBiC1930]|uniref:hypothetical protein n=1 Tax=Seonamhaeicola sp. MEBiC01930 TaxID=2976768 RepID=UPI0032442EB0
MSIYPEIEILKQYFKDFEIYFEKVDSIDNKPDAFWVTITISGNSWNIFIDDEYQHFNNEKPLINLYLTLVALEIYKASDDFLVWCREQVIDDTIIKWLDYYKSLNKTYREIESILGKIDSVVPYFDYSLQTGVGKALLNAKMS